MCFLLCQMTDNHIFRKTEMVLTIKASGPICLDTAGTEMHAAGVEGMQSPQRRPYASQQPHTVKS